MAPKRKGSARGAGKPLVAPVVSEQELNEAKQLLEDAAQKKRARSNLSYYLQINGLTDSFEAMEKDEKTKYMTSWFAQRVTEKKGELTNTLKTVKEGSINTERGRAFIWVTKEKMEIEIGKEAAKEKIASGKLQTRPDPDTGSTSEHAKEYKLYRTVGSEMEVTKNGQRLEQEEDVAENGLQEAVDNIDGTLAALGQGRGGSSADGRGNAFGDAVKVKQEPQGDSSPEPSNPHLATFNTLQKEPQKVQRKTADELTDLKQMYEATKDKKFFAVINQETEKLIPKVASLYRRLERVVVEGISDEATLQALAKTKGELGKSYDEVAEWYGRMNPGKGKKARKS